MYKITLVKNDLKHDPERTHRKTQCRQSRRTPSTHVCLRHSAGKGKTKGDYFVYFVDNK
jgi:hypothetical protein